MRGGWSRFGLYIVAVAALIAVVLTATTGAERSVGEVLAQVLFIGAVAYLLTFIAWPRRTPLSSNHPSMSGAKKAPASKDARPQPDKRPVVVIGPRPAGSRPGAEIHAIDDASERPSRGRRPSERQSTGEMRWPAR